MNEYKDYQLIWFREYKPEENTIDTICKEFTCKRVEFYCLSVNVCKVERGILIKLDTINDIFRLNKLLNTHIIASRNKYNFEDKILYGIIRDKNFFWI